MLHQHYIVLQQLDLCQLIPFHKIFFPCVLLYFVVTLNIHSPNFLRSYIFSNTENFSILQVAHFFARIVQNQCPSFTGQ